MRLFRPKKSILVVNDTKYLLAIARDELKLDRETAWTVYLVNNQNELNTVLTSGRQIDLALVDMRLQRIFGGEEDYKFLSDGMTIAEKLKGKGIRVGITSADVQEYQRVQGRKLGIPIFDTTNLIMEGGVRHVFLEIAREMIKGIENNLVIREHET